VNIHAIIPARGGSKGIPKKNIIDFCGKPLLAWTILQLKLVNSLADIWVSSDDEDILDIAERYGARKILRPKEISGDNATSESAWSHSVSYIEDRVDNSVDYVLGPQVTSPLREPKDFLEAIAKIQSSEADSLLSVVRIEDHFIWEGHSKGGYRPTNYDHRKRKLRQQIDSRFLENGSFYLFTPELLRQTRSRLGGEIEIYVMDKYKVFQIDNNDDIRLCSTIMRAYGLDRL
jgi:CMP-N,N'-diacetyllegionaminic acid synthase